MNDATPSNTTPASADDVQVTHAPPPVPALSRFALMAFVMSFLGGFIALMGFWYVEFVPIALAALALYTIRSSGKRGRILSIFAIIIAVGFGSCSWFIHSGGTKAFAAVPRELLTILSDKETTPEAKDALLEGWAWPDVLKENPGLAASWREAYALIVAEYGPWTGELEFGDDYPGFLALIMPPPHGDELGLSDEAASKAVAETLAPGGAIWVKGLFAKGPVWMCAVLGTGKDDHREALVKGQKDGVSPMVGAIRYFRP